MLLDSPLHSAEFLAVDTETNGLARERCELTEVGAVLVGGGELHERWSSVVGVASPLSPGIQRFTHITQAMVDAAPPPERVLPAFAAQLRGRVLVAHNASFDGRVLRQAFARAGLDWPAPPVLCTVAMARRLAPLQRRRGLAQLAEALGIEVGTTHRALPDAELCAQVFCALFKRLCANAPTVGEAVALLRARGVRGGVTRPRAGRQRVVRPVERRPDLRALTPGPGVYVFRDADGRPLYVGKSVSVRKRARSHFTAGAAWTARAEQVDCEETASELGALLLEHRLIRALKPAANVRGVREADGHVFIRCRLDIAFPILEVAREPAAGHAVCIGPVRGRAAAAELVEQLNSLFGLRHCSRKLPRRYHPSAYGEMGRCLSPCLGDLDPNLYRERLEGALRLFVDARDGGRALLVHVEAQMAEASGARQYERAATLRRRRDRLDSLVFRLGGVLRAVHSGARLVVARHPDRAGHGDALLISGGRVVDWLRLPEAGAELVARAEGAVRAAPRAHDLGGWLPADEIDEVRLVGGYVISHDLRSLELPAPDVEGFVARALA
ncbi:MAG: exonuclease domain-containing protein [Solirubrobacteraceae bacterium]